MTVQELIDELNKIENKELYVKMWMIIAGSGELQDVQEITVQNECGSGYVELT